MQTDKKLHHWKKIEKKTVTSERDAGAKIGKMIAASLLPSGE